MAINAPKLNLLHNFYLAWAINTKSHKNVYITSRDTCSQRRQNYENLFSWYLEQYLSQSFPSKPKGPWAILHMVQFKTDSRKKCIYEHNAEVL